MIQDIRIHGFVPETAQRYEYFTTVIGPGINMRFFYEQGNDMRGPHDRFFLGGNELSLTRERIYHRGNGGTFCEYMLGMEQSFKDLLKPDIRNRLAMYGARYDDEGERIIFNNETTGTETYRRIFEEGHAFTNFYFFIAGDIQGDLRTVQETILRFTGKTLKRTELSSDLDGTSLATRLFHEINIPRWTLFIVKLVDRFAQDYYQNFIGYYRSGRAIDVSEKENLLLLADRYHFSRSERERLELDVIQKQPENRQLIENYREALVSLHSSLSDERTVQFKRNRLRTLGARRHLPPLLFDKLDRMLKPRQKEGHLPSFLLILRKSMMELLEEKRAAQGLTEDDIVNLLSARLEALVEHQGKFEDTISDIGRGRTGVAAELYSVIIAHFERFEDAYEIVHNLAFVDDYELQEDQISFLTQAQDITDNIKNGLFEELIFQTIERQQYLNLYGRERIRRLREGIRGLLVGEQVIKDIIAGINQINKELRLRRTVDTALRERVRDIYKEPLTKQEQEFLRSEISHKLIQQNLIKEEVPIELFAAALFAIREEFLYINEMLPQIVANRDRQLREDFLENSELDRFRTEELEHQYFRTHQVNPEIMEWFWGEMKT